MDSSAGRYLFQKRNERIDWRKLAAVDVERIAREVDVDAIQENILNVTYCNVEHELGYHGLDANVIKLFRLAQLTIEYLLHSQEFLQQCMNDKDKKLETFNEQLNVSLSQCSDAKDELSKRNESYKGLKKELQKSKKLIGDYQLMVRAGASGLHRCASCMKSFVSEYYLRSHMERRHAEELKRNIPQLPTTTIIDQSLNNELNEIKSRLKITEEELKREHDNVHRLSLKEVERNQELQTILQMHETWKTEEQEQIKADIEGYKNMMMKEMKETKKENNVLQKNLHNLQQSTELWRKSTLGNLEDDDDDEGNNAQYEDLGSQIKELSQQLNGTCKENDELKKKVDKWKAASKSLASDDKKYGELDAKVRRMEVHYKREFDRLSNKYQDDLQQAKELCNEYVAKVKQKNYLSTLDIVDAKPLRSPRAFDAEADSVSLWVSSNASIINCYKVSQKTASVKGEWNDVFSFRALLSAGDLFEKPIYVYTCGGSPYWRQYISLSDQPPSPNYRKEFTFYVAATKLIGTLKLFILDTGSSTVIRSMISRKESVDGWKEKGAYFYALKPGVTKSSLNRSGTYNSEVFRSVSDDEVSLSSLTGTDMVRDNLAEALKLSRENLCEDPDVNDDKILDEVEEFKDESDSDSDRMEIGDELNEEHENDKFVGTSSSSFLGSTLPEKGQFYPFSNNRLAVARYNHTSKMVNAQREEMIKILEDNLIKRGIDLDEEQMSSTIYESKLKNHDKEVKLIEKRYSGCIERRKRILKSVDDYALDEFDQKKKGKMSGRWKPVDNVVKAAVRFSDVITPINKRNDALLPPNTDAVTATSTPIGKDKGNTSLENEDFNDSESSPEWNSEELENKFLQQQKNKTLPGTGGNDVLLNDFVSSGGNKQELHRQVSKENRPAPKLTNDNRDDLSNSSGWDSDELSVKHLQESPDDILSNTLEDSFDQYDLYNPKMRPPKGEKVKELAASLEFTLGSRDPTKKKPAGAVDLHHL